jgi:Bacteriophage lambda ea8.5-related domain
MGFAKEQMLHHQDQIAVATDIAVEAGVLSRCEFHDTVLDNETEPTDAYKLANWKFSHGKLRDAFETRREMTDAVQEAIQDSSSFGCGLCESILDD